MPALTAGRPGPPETRAVRLPTRLPWVLGGLAFLALAMPVVAYHVIATAAHGRMVDLNVYRLGGHAVLTGQPLYQVTTPPPVPLPFTYPPLAALFAVPLSLLPRAVADGLWTAGVLACTVALTAIGFRRLLPRAGRWAPLACGVLAGAVQWLTPFRDEVKFGQVDELLALMCVLDCLSRRTRWPRGLLIGVAAAVKLEPAVFIPYLWFTGRRRAAVVASGTFAGLTLLSAGILPADSQQYWLHALFHPERMLNNAGTSNQSLRGMVLRLALPGPATAALLLSALAVVAWFGYRRAVRAAAAGDQLAGVTITGLLWVLLSPVAWIHHLAWLPLVIGVVLDRGTDRRRVLGAAAVWGFYLTSLPWWGQHWLSHHEAPGWFCALVQDSFGLAALALLALLPWREQTRPPETVRLLTTTLPEVHTGTAGLAASTGGGR